MGFLQIFLFLITSLCNDSVHEYHLSNTEIRYNQEDQALQITTRIFIDDLEESLGNEGHTGLSLCTEKEPAYADSLVAEYLFEKIFIAVDEEEVAYSYLGKEISDDLIAVWCYLEVEGVTPQKSIEIENTVLLETFDDQQNIVRIKSDTGSKAMFILKEGNTKGALKL